MLWRSEGERTRTVAELSELLTTPVGFERADRVARCLELRLNWTSATAVKVTLTFRTDLDRQGESGDVRTWPEWQDPRALALLRGLLAGLASKVMQYSNCEVGGYTSSIRGAVRFLRGLHYPSKRWLRLFGAELLRHGAPLGCLPKVLRAALVVERS